MLEFQDLREACCEANRQLGASGLVDLTFGNASVLDPDRGIFAIKPSGVPYASLRPDDIPVMDLEGRRVAGTLHPSSDEPTHRRLLAAFAPHGVRSVVHTHSRAAVAFAQAAREIPPLGTTHADHFRGSVPVTRGLSPGEVASAYEWETAGVILEIFESLNPADMPAVLVRHHGPFCWGSTAAKALENALALEIVADMALRTLALHPQASPAPSHLCEKHFLRKHGPGATYGQRVGGA